MQAQTAHLDLVEYPIHLMTIPPPSPFNRETALRWLREEADSLLMACQWGMMNFRDEETRDSFAMLLGDAARLVQAAAEVVADGKPERPIALDTNPLEASDSIKNLMRCVRSALCDQNPRCNAPRVDWFAPLAEILEARIKIERELKGESRFEAIESLGYPMADEEEPAAADVEQPLAAVAVGRDEVATCEGCGQRASLPEKGLPEGWNGRLLEGTAKQTQHHDGVGLTYLHLWLRFCSEACADEWMSKATTWPADNVRLPIEPGAWGGRGGFLMAKPNGKGDGKARKAAPKRESTYANTSILPSPKIGTARAAHDFLTGEISVWLNVCSDLNEAGVRLPDMLAIDLAELTKAATGVLDGGPKIKPCPPDWGSIAEMASTLDALLDKTRNGVDVEVDDGPGFELLHSTIPAPARLIEQQARHLADSYPEMWSGVMKDRRESTELRLGAERAERKARCLEGRGTPDDFRAQLRNDQRQGAQP